MNHIMAGSLNPVLDAFFLNYRFDNHSDDRFLSYDVQDTQIL